MKRGYFPILVLVALICASTSFAAERVIDLTATDGTKLKATFFPGAKPGPGVLLLHQCNRQRKVWDGLAQQLASAGINVLTLDYRGYGGSTGSPMCIAPGGAQATSTFHPTPRLTISIAICCASSALRLDYFLA